jgi:hypothetical protein
MDSNLATPSSMVSLLTSLESPQRSLNLYYITCEKYTTIRYMLWIQSFPVFSRHFRITPYHITRHAMIHRPDTEKAFPHYVNNIFVCRFLKFSFYFCISTFCHHFNISVFFCRISYSLISTDVTHLHDLLNRQFLYRNRMNHFYCVLKSSTNLVFVVMTAARLQ